MRWWPRRSLWRHPGRQLGADHRTQDLALKHIGAEPDLFSYGSASGSAQCGRVHLSRGTFHPGDAGVFLPDVCLSRDPAQAVAGGAGVRRLLDGDQVGKRASPRYDRSGIDRRLRHRRVRGAALRIYRSRGRHLHRRLAGQRAHHHRFFQLVTSARPSLSSC